jgi:hypothetical protein
MAEQQAGDGAGGQAPEQSGGGQQQQAAGAQAAGGERATEQTTDPAAIRAQVEAELRAEHAAQLKQLTGHETFDAAKAAADKAAADALAEQGKFKELAESRGAALEQARGELRTALVSAALGSAAAASVDPETVQALLAPRAQVDEHGSVTIDGKPADVAVSELLKAKPHLARAAGSSGSGSGGAGGGTPQAPKRADYSDDIQYHRAVAKFRAAQEG